MFLFSLSPNKTLDSCQTGETSTHNQFVPGSNNRSENAVRKSFSLCLEAYATAAQKMVNKEPVRFIDTEFTL